jgi:hypothetical protein
MQVRRPMSVVPTVRTATEADLADIQRLISLPRDFVLAPGGAASGERRIALVVDRAGGGGLAAAALVSIAPPLAQLEALAMAPHETSQALEARVLAVADALAVAFGCDYLEVARRAA